MKRLSKRVSCCLLALSLVIAFVPFVSSASAEETGQNLSVYEKTLDYATLHYAVANAGDGQEITAADFSALGIVEAHNMTVLDGYWLPEANWMTLNNYYTNGGEFPKPYVVYRTKPNTAFEITMNYDKDSKTSMEDGLGQPYEVKLYVSKDSKNWVETGFMNSAETEFSIQRNNEEYKMLRTTNTVLSTGTDGYFVKVEYPHNGKEKQYLENLGNWNVGIEKVRFTSDISSTCYFGAASSLYTDTRFTSEAKLGMTGAVVQSGVDVNKNGITIDWYTDSTPRANPYVIFEAETGTPFKLQATRNAAYEAKIAATLDTADEKFMVKVYTSADMESWQECPADFRTNENKYQTKSKTTYATFGTFLDNGARFVKVVFPQTVALSQQYPDTFGGINGNDFIMLNLLDYVAPAMKDAAEVYRYEVGSEVRNAITETKITASNLNAFGACNASLATAADWAPTFGFLNTGIKMTDGYVMANKNVAGRFPPYIVYSVDPGSKFAAHVYLNAADKATWEQLPEHKDTYTFEYALETSADSESWTRIASTGDKAGYMVLSATVPQDMRYVRVVFPQRGANSDGKYYDNSAVLCRVTRTPEQALSAFDREYKYLYDEPLTAEKPIRYENEYMELGADGIAPANGDADWQASLVRNKDGSLGAGFAHISYYDNTKTYITYNVSGARKVYADFKINSNGKAAWEAEDDFNGLKFEFKVYDADTDTLLAGTGDLSGEFTFEIPVPRGTDRIKVEFPQIGRKNKKAYNDMAALKRIAFNFDDQPSYLGKLEARYTVHGRYGKTVSVISGQHTTANSTRIIGTLADTQVNAVVLGFSEAGKHFRVYAANNPTELFDRCVLEGESVVGEQLYVLSLPVDGSYIGVEAEDGSVTLLSSLKNHEVLPGDLDGNGQLDEEDIAFMKRCLLGICAIDERIADANGSDGPDIRDLVHLNDALA